MVRRPIGKPSPGRSPPSSPFPIRYSTRSNASSRRPKKAFVCSSTIGQRGRRAMTNDHPQSKDQQPPAQTAIAERLGDQPKPPADLTFPPLPGIGIDLVTLGRFLVQSGYFTDVKSISQAAVKVLLGQELGVPPITAMMHVYLVQGRPALASGLMAAKIKGSGRYSYKIVRHD